MHLYLVFLEPGVIRELKSATSKCSPSFIELDFSIIIQLGTASILISNSLKSTNLYCTILMLLVRTKSIFRFQFRPSDIIKLSCRPMREPTPCDKIRKVTRLRKSEITYNLFEGLFPG